MPIAAGLQNSHHSEDSLARVSNYSRSSGLFYHQVKHSTIRMITAKRGEDCAQETTIERARLIVGISYRLQFT